MKLKEVLFENMVTQLVQLCKRELGINQLPPIKLLHNSDSTGGGTSFGQFEDDTISVVTKDRHPMDVMRTLTHELVHWKQRTNGQVMDGSDGSDTENQANAVAGIIMRKFGQMYPDYFINSLP
jgi:hypothetical protein